MLHLLSLTRILFTHGLAFVQQWLYVGPKSSSLGHEGQIKFKDQTKIFGRDLKLPILTNAFSVLFLKTSDTGNKSPGRTYQRFTCIAVKGLPIPREKEKSFTAIYCCYFLPGLLEINGVLPSLHCNIIATELLSSIFTS